MKQKFWNAMKVAAPLALIIPSFSFSQIPKFFTGDEFRFFLESLVTQLAIGISDAFINVATLSAFGVL